MPELPEVETIVKGMRLTLTGRKIISARQSGMKMRAQRVRDFSKEIVNKAITGISRRGKYILIHLDDGSSIIFHLGMSGRILVGHSIPANKHDHAVFTFSDGQSMVFNDPRRFGIICYTTEGSMKPAILKNLGVEPLTEGFCAQYLIERLSKLKSPVKSVIMNAAIVVGVGNIYACESLFNAGLHPLVPANRISFSSAVKLVNEIKATLEQAIAAGGSTLRDYVRLNGDVGGFQHKFKVYGRKNHPCTSCTTPIQMLRLGGRSTYYCPQCQGEKG